MKYFLTTEYSPFEKVFPYRVSPHTMDYANRRDKIMVPDDLAKDFTESIQVLQKIIIAIMACPRDPFSEE